MRPTVLLALLVLAAGCASPGAPHQDAPFTCAPVASDRGGGDPVCLVTSDGWILQGAAWNLHAANATTVLLVHGLNEDRHSYDTLANDLAAKGWRVVAFDLRGHGESTRLVGNTSRTWHDFHAGDFLSLHRDLEAAGALAPPQLVVGASVGANAALAYAAATPGVRAAALLSAGDVYQQIDATGPAASYHGALLFLASQGDAYAASSAKDLSARHPGAHDVAIVDGGAHGTQLLQDAARRGGLESWLAQH